MCLDFCQRDTTILVFPILTTNLKEGFTVPIHTHYCKLVYVKNRKVYKRTNIFRDDSRHAHHAPYSVDMTVDGYLYLVNVTEWIEGFPGLSGVFKFGWGKRGL